MDGALPAKTKGLLGLVASLVMRCDDCIHYHIIQCQKEGVKDEELEEAVGVGRVAEPPANHYLGCSLHRFTQDRFCKIRPTEKRKEETMK